MRLWALNAEEHQLLYICQQTHLHATNTVCMQRKLRAYNSARRSTPGKLDGGLAALDARVHRQHLHRKHTQHSNLFALMHGLLHVRVPLSQKDT